jgi:hypothetical protein
MHSGGATLAIQWKAAREQTIKHLGSAPVEIAKFAKIVKIVEPATDMTGEQFAFGVFIYQ